MSASLLPLILIMSAGGLSAAEFQVVDRLSVNGSVLFRSTVTLAGTVTLSTGSAAFPSLIFPGDTGTGIWHEAPGQLAFSAGGVENFAVKSNRVDLNIQMRAVTGLVSAPIYSFSADSTMGMTRS